MAAEPRTSAACMYDRDMYMVRSQKGRSPPHLGAFAPDGQQHIALGNLARFVRRAALEDGINLSTCIVVRMHVHQPVHMHSCAYEYACMYAST
jgi:hypothetical protein